MSSSLFYDCNGEYETYPSTKRVEGDTTFGEVKKGGILYCLSTVKVKGDYQYKFEELAVVKPWHVSHGNFYISCKRVGKGSKPYNINFGTSYVIRNTSESSVVFFDHTIIGTNKESLYNIKRLELTEEIAQLGNKMDAAKSSLLLLEKLKERIVL